MTVIDFLERLLHQFCLLGLVELPVCNGLLNFRAAQHDLPVAGIIPHHLQADCHTQLEGFFGVLVKKLPPSASEAI